MNDSIGADPDKPAKTLMITTELTRIRYKMRATSEEWKASGDGPESVPEKGWWELERHSNTTEHTVFFAALAGVFELASPPIVTSAVQ